MAQGEGVGVHHDGGGGLFGAALGQPGAEAGKAVFSVLQEGEGVFHSGDLIKSQVLKELGGTDFRVHEQVGAPLPGQPLHQVGDDLVQQALPLVGVVHGKAPQGGAKEAAGGGQVVILVKQPAGVVQVAVQRNALLLQQGADLSHAAAVVRTDFREGVGHGGTSKTESGAAAAAAAPLTLWYHR